MAKFIVSKSYQLSKQYAAEVVKHSESVEFEGTAMDAHVVGIALNEKVRALVWGDAVSSGIISKEDAEIYVNVSRSMLELAKSKAAEGISEDAQGLVVGTILVAEDILNSIDEVINS